MAGSFDITNVNILGAILATCVGQFISAMWFGPLFNKQWQKYCRWNEEEVKKYMEENQRHTKSIYMAFIEQFISVLVFGMFLHNLEITLTINVIKLAVVVWFGFMATVCINEVLWHGENIKFYILNQASYLVRTVAMGIVYSWIAL